MANLYTPESLGIKIPKGQEGDGNWIQGRQIWGGKLSDPGVINPLSNQQGAGQTVSKEVNAQSAAAQGVTAQNLEAYLQTQRNNQANANVVPSGTATPSGMPGTTGDAGLGLTMPTATSLNLPELYKSLYETQGVSQLEKTLNDKANAFATAQSKINDNPFLSEGNRVGRVSKLTTDYNASVKNDQDLLAMKKQDIATQLDLATKQFDIESTQAKAALDQFNTLLQSGALAGASGNDIASITAATGISSSMIQSAIKAQTQKDIKTSVTTADDGKNVYSVVINSNTGEIISKQIISASKPAAAKETSESDKKSYYQNALRTDAASGKVSINQAFSLYSGYLDPNTILYLYNANSATPNTDYASLAQYGVKDPTKSASLAEQLGLSVQ